MLSAELASNDLHAEEIARRAQAKRLSLEIAAQSAREHHTQAAQDRSIQYLKTRAANAVKDGIGALDPDRLAT